MKWTECMNDHRDVTKIFLMSRTFSLSRGYIRLTKEYSVGEERKEETKRILNIKTKGLNTLSWQKEENIHFFFHWGNHV